MELILNSGVKIKFDEFVGAQVAIFQSSLYELSIHTRYVVNNNFGYLICRNYLKTLTHALATKQPIELMIFVKVNGVTHTFSEYHKTKLVALNRARSLNKRYKSCQDIL